MSLLSKKMLAIALCGIMASASFTACGDKAGSQPGDSNSSVSDVVNENVEIMNFTAPQNGDTIIEMNIKDYGTVKIRLFPEYAETGVDNFVQLAESGYYDGLTFHRVISDFMIQGGDPMGNGTGGASIWGGQFDGGTDPHLIHVSGALAYANSGSTETNGSQFYIVTGTEITDDDITTYEQYYGLSFSENQKAAYKRAGGTPFLDGNYTVFGQVFDGLDIIYKIQYVPTNVSDKPLGDGVIIESVKVSKYNGEDLKWYLSDYSDYQDPADAEPVNFSDIKEGEEIAVMDIEGYGTVKIRFFPEYAPEAVENFVQHAKDGYYDGVTFHRIIEDFMIQGGDPKGDGTGGESIWGEKFDGGKYYNLVHARGAIAYANSGGTNTNGSQFYIVTGEDYDDEAFANLEANPQYSFRDSVKEFYKKVGGTPFLDRSYTVFGQVFDGLDVVFKIQSVEVDAANNSRPLKDVVINSIKIEKYDGSAPKWYISDYDMTDNTDEDPEEATEEETDTEEPDSDEDADTNADTDNGTDEGVQDDLENEELDLIEDVTVVIDESWRR